jgi:hypothetical protein
VNKVIDPYLVLGLAKGSSATKVKDTFEELSQHLEPARFVAGSRPAEHAARALAACKSAYDAITSGSSEEVSANIGEGLSARLRLGQLCLASHMISLEQLQEAVAEQATSDKQLGEILQDKNFISQEELDGLLIGQELIVGDEEVKDPQALRLLAMGVISEELAVLGLLETRLTGEAFVKVLHRRDWLSKEISLAIFGNPDL